MKRFFLFVTSLILITVNCIENTAAEGFSGEAVKLAFELEGSSYVSYERTDARRYDNGRYTGLVSREVRSQVNPIDPPKGAGFQNDSWFKGNFMITEETNSSSVKLRPFNSLMPTTFHISSNGTLTVVPGYNADHTYRRDSGFPTYRSFPSYPAGEINVGDSWTSTAYRAVDPLGTGIFTKLQIAVQYTYVGDETYKGTPCRKINAKWATRYGSGTLYHDYDGDPSLTGATGSHTADIMVSVETGAAIVISDRYDETFTYRDGNSVRFSGTCTLFTEYTPAVDRSAIISTLGKIAKVTSGTSAQQSDSPEKVSGMSGNGGKSNNASGNTLQGNTGSQQSSTMSTADMLRQALTGGRMSSDSSSAGTGNAGTMGNRRSGSTASEVQNTAGAVSSGADVGDEDDSDVSGNMYVEEVENGVRLSVRDIRFVADSARILSDESWRLDAIADVLKLLPGRLFLIEGHAASTGNPVGEQTLSVERAKTICEELIKRGIAEEQLTYTGYGSTRPVADNSTSEGKAQNRRVEITILD